MMFILELQLYLIVSCGRCTLLRIQAVFHIVMGQYVRALPMNLILVGDQVHGELAPPCVLNGTSWKILHIQAAIPAVEQAQVKLNIY